MKIKDQQGGGEREVVFDEMAIRAHPASTNVSAQMCATSRPVASYLLQEKKLRRYMAVTYLEFFVSFFLG